MMREKQKAGKTPFLAQRTIVCGGVAQEKDLTMVGSPSYSRRAQGCRSRQEELDGLLHQDFSPCGWDNHSNDGGRRDGNPFGGADSAFQHGATEMGIGKTQYQHWRDLGAPRFSPTGAGGGRSSRAQLGAAKEKMEKKTIVTLLVSPPSKYTCVCPPPPEPPMGSSLAAGCRSV